MKLPLRECAGKTVYITGGSAGIGRAIAQRFTALGADVLLFARRESLLTEAVTALEADTVNEMQRIEYRVLDVSDTEHCQEVLSEASTTFGVPDILINNAGRALPAYFETITPAQLEETFRINFFGCWNTIQAVLPKMKEAGGGYIVNVASLAGLIGVFGYTDYCASKFALVGFSEALRSELKPHGIMISVLCPPDTDTPGLAAENECKPPETKALSGKARPLSADVVAEALLKGMRKGNPLIIPGMDGKLAYLLKRLAPGLVTRIMERTIRKAQE